MKKFLYLLTATIFLGVVYVSLANVLERENLSGALMSTNALSITGAGSLLALILRLYLILVFPVITAVLFALAVTDRMLRRKAARETAP